MINPEFNLSGINRTLKPLPPAPCLLTFLTTKATGRQAPPLMGEGELAKLDGLRVKITRKPSNFAFYSPSQLGYD